MTIFVHINIYLEFFVLMAAELLVLFFMIVSEPLFYETNMRDGII